MSKTMTRRAAVTGLATAPAALAASGLPSLAAGDPDPIFAAIDAHRKADSTYVAAVHRNCDLEESIPLKARKSDITCYTRRIVDTDDPRWIASEIECVETGNAVHRAAWNLVAVKPATFAGVVALLDYTNWYVDAGKLWPDWNPELGENVDWGEVDCRHVAAALRDILAKGGAA